MLTWGLLTYRRPLKPSKRYNKPSKRQYDEMTKGVSVAGAEELGERASRRVKAASPAVERQERMRDRQPWESATQKPPLALVDSLNETGLRYRGLTLRSGGEEVLTTWRQEVRTSLLKTSAI